MTPEEVHHLLLRLREGALAQDAVWSGGTWSQFVAQTPPPQPMVGVLEHNPAADAARTRALRGEPR